MALAAPTGKAAARLAEAVAAEAGGLATTDEVRAALLATAASTLHRLLGWQPGSRSRFRHDATNQLPHSVVIVDESSMVSLSMMASLLAAVRPTSRLVLVGDPRQLASVEAGAVLGDIVGPAADGLLLSEAAQDALERGRRQSGRRHRSRRCGATADSTVVLRRVHRFRGGIAELAEAIERGHGDDAVAVLRSGYADVTWIEPVDGPLDPFTAEALGAVRRSVLAAAAVGAAVAAAQAGRAIGKRWPPCGRCRCCARTAAGPPAPAPGEPPSNGGCDPASTATGCRDGPWYAGRPILVTENDYGLGVFNGDTGVVVDAGGGRLRAVFERRGEPLSVRPTRLASVDSLYAMTIHKAQGSQFAEVVVVLPESSPILTRELLYTGVTRAQERVTLVAPEATVRATVARPVARASGLAEALWGATTR